MPLPGLGTAFDVWVRFGLDNAAFMNKLQAMGAQMRNVGMAMTRSLTLPILALGVNMLRMAGNFEQAMNQVEAVTQGTREEMELLNSVAQELGRTTKFSATQAAEGMSFLAMAGFEVNEIAEAMPAVLELAAAAQMDLATAADISSNIMTGYRMEVSELTGAIDIMAGAFTGSNTNLVQLGEAMAYVGPIAAGLEIPFEETAAVLGMFGNAGIQASRAGTSLRMGLLRLIDPPGDAAEALDALGISTIDADGNFRGLTTVILDLATAMEERGFTETERLAATMEIFGRRAGGPFASVIAQGREELLGFVDALKDVEGLAGDIAETQMEGLNGQLIKLKSAFEGLMIAIADTGILESITEFAEQVTALTAAMAESDPEMMRLGLTIAGIVAVLGPLLVILGTIITMAPGIGAAVAFMFGPWGLVIAGVVAGLTLLINKIIAVKRETREKIEAMQADLDATIALRDETAALTGELEALEGEADETGEVFADLETRVIDLVTAFPKLLTQIGYSITAEGELQNATGETINDLAGLQTMFDTFSTVSAVNQINQLIAAMRQRQIEEVRVQFHEERRDLFGWFNTVIGLGAWQREGERRSTADWQFQQWLVENYPDLAAPVQPIEPAGAEAGAGAGAGDGDGRERPAGGGGDEDGTAAAELAAAEALLLELQLIKTQADIDAAKAEEELLRIREEHLNTLSDLTKAEEERLEQLVLAKEKADELAAKAEEELAAERARIQLLKENAAKEADAARAALLASGKIWTDIHNLMLKQIRELGRAIVSGDIAKALERTFDMLGNIIAEHISTRISAQIPGFGGGLLGGLGAGLVGGAISWLGNELFGGDKMPGSSPAKLNFTYITNWEDFFQFGTTLPQSFVLSGRAGGYNVDPHGRTLDLTEGGWESGQHFDL